MHPVFGAQQGIGAVFVDPPADLQDRVSQPASRSVVYAEDGAAPAVGLGPVGVHARERFDPVLGVLPAGVGLDGYYRAPAVLLGPFPPF